MKSRFSQTQRDSNSSLNYKFTQGQLFWMKDEALLFSWYPFTAMTSYDDCGPRAVTEAVVVCGRRPPNVVYLLFQQGLPCVFQLCCWGPEKHLVGNGYSLRGCVWGVVNDKFCGWKINKIVNIKLYPSHYNVIRT